MWDGRGRVLKILHRITCYSVFHSQATSVAHSDQVPFETSLFCSCATSYPAPSKSKQGHKSSFFLAGAKAKGGKWGTTHRYKVVTVQMSVVVSSCYSRAGCSSKPVPGFMAVASWGSSVTMRLVSILVRVLVILFHQRWVVPAVLWPRGETVAIFPCPFVMVVFVCGHQGATFDGRMVSCVVAVAVSLGLFEIENADSVCVLYSSWSGGHEGQQ